tara:strand:- start:2034 stop:3578 length:1545 start_codon:yes stop_codon:yes gene_type:complete
MAATLEVNYFSTFWLKKINSIVEVKDTTGTANASTGTVISLTAANINVGAGQIVTNLTVPFPGNPVVTVLSVAANNQTITIDSAQPIVNNNVIAFTGRAGDAYVPEAFEAVNSNDWYIEEARIRGGYNNTSVDFGVKAYIVEDTFKQQHRISSLIYSGIFNSRTGVNNTNQFSVGEDITKSADPANGSIQKLYAEDTNLIIFQEDKVSRALIDKDAIYSAEGGGSVTSSNLVIGQIVAYAGEYGISTNPESFAVYGYRKYFTDKKRGCVLRLSADGITEISSYGMHDFFRDELASATKIVGGWNSHTKDYVLSIQTDSDYNTATFDEGVLGWTSFSSYKPSYVFSLSNVFYTFNQDIDANNNLSRLYQHYLGNYGQFYGATYNSDVTVVLNSNPSVVKNFKTINYEGGLGWELESMVASSSDKTLPIGKYVFQDNLASLETQIWSNTFKKKEDKYFANLINNSPAVNGEILYGADMSGIKGFYSTVKMKLNNITYPTIKKELFSVSSDVVESSY